MGLGRQETALETSALQAPGRGPEHQLGRAFIVNCLETSEDVVMVRPKEGTPRLDERRRA